MFDCDYKKSVFINDFFFGNGIVVMDSVFVCGDIKFDKRFL